MNTLNYKSRDSGFTLNDLLVVIGTCCMLALLVLPALGSAKDNSRQFSCLNNLRQLGIATRMYVVDYQQYTGVLYMRSPSHYVWPRRLLSYTGGQRSLFSCPAATPKSWWDTNLNNTVQPKVDETGKADFYSITPTTRFSYGINDWGLGFVGGGLGLGGDLDAGQVVRESDLFAPSQMIMLGDTSSSASVVNFGASMDPRSPAGDSSQPSNRHQYQTDLVFADGHTETPLRKDVIDPTNNFWRSRWNTDNNPHNEVANWTVWGAAPLDPSY